VLKKMLLETEDRASWIFQIIDERTGVIHEDPSGRAHNDRETASRALTKFCDSHPEFTGLPCETIALTRDEQDATIARMERLARVREEIATESATESATRVGDSAAVELLDGPPPPVKFTEIEVLDGESIPEALERAEREEAEKATADVVKPEAKPKSKPKSKPEAGPS
jgi:hypothetical protein